MLQEPAATSAQKQTHPCPQGAHWEDKIEMLDWLIQVPKALECSPQPSMSPPSPFPAPPLPTAHTQAASVLWGSPSFFPFSCKCIHLPLGLLFAQSAPSPPPGLKLHATSYRKPSWCPWSSRPSTVSQLLESGCFLCPTGLQGRSRARCGAGALPGMLDSCRWECIINRLRRVSRTGEENVEKSPYFQREAGGWSGNQGRPRQDVGERRALSPADVQVYFSHFLEQEFTSSFQSFPSPVITICKTSFPRCAWGKSSPRQLTSQGLKMQRLWWFPRWVFKLWTIHLHVGA